MIDASCRVLDLFIFGFGRASYPRWHIPFDFILFCRPFVCLFVCAAAAASAAVIKRTKKVFYLVAEVAAQSHLHAIYMRIVVRIHNNNNNKYANKL